MTISFDATSNIINVWRMATPDEKVEGARWYLDAQRDAETIAIRHDVPMITVVGVIAALSPNNKWVRNIENASTLVAAYMAGDDIESFKVSCYNAMKRKAWSIMADMITDKAEMLVRLNGRKIQNFARCIWGDGTSVCVDGHARNIAYAERIGLTDSRTNIGVREYRFLTDSYNEAAAIVGVPGYVMQAVTWTVWRRVHGIT
tara:strand:+ start:18236 stop:18841 length:606 start_codon:yes stop_codon:yes gene_type:complete